MRSAWNTRWQVFRIVSFFSFSGRKSSVFSITVRSFVVLSMRFPLRISSVIAFAISSQYGSSEFSYNIPASSSLLIWSSLSAALIPFCWFSLRSKGPSARKENPRFGLSICMEDTPRSAKIKSNPPASFAISSIVQKFWSFMVRILSPNPCSSRRFFVFADSSGSTSVAYIWPSPWRHSIIAFVWPPYPSVASNPVSPGWIFRKSRISFTIMEMCIPAGVFPFRITCSTVSWYFSGFSSLYFSSNFFGYFPLYLTRRLCGFGVSCCINLSLCSWIQTYPAFSDWKSKIRLFSSICFFWLYFEIIVPI